MNGILAYFCLQRIAKILDTRHVLTMMFHFGGKACFDQEKKFTLDFLRFFCSKIGDYYNLRRF